MLNERKQGTSAYSPGDRGENNNKKLHCQLPLLTFTLLSWLEVTHPLKLLHPLMENSF